MDINHKIVLVTVVLVLASGIAVSEKRVWVENRIQQKSETTEKPQVQLSDEDYVILKIDELKKSVNKDELYKYYTEYYMSIKDKDGEIQVKAEQFHEETENIARYSAECLALIENVENSQDSYADKRKAANALSEEEPFVLLQNTLVVCEEMKYEISKIIENDKSNIDYRMHKESITVEQKEENTDEEDIG